MLGRACSVFVVLILQGPALSAAYQVETENAAPKYLDAASIKLRDDGGQYIVFDAKSCNDVFVNLMNLASPSTFRISLCSGPHHSRIVACRDSKCKTEKKKMLHQEFCKDLASFWISCSGSEIAVGNGCEVGRSALMTVASSAVFALRNVSFSSKEAASWRFGESSACEAMKTTTAQITTTTPSTTTDSGQVSTSSQTDHQSSTTTKEETKSENKADSTTVSPNEKMSPKDKANSLAPCGSTAQFWVIIAIAVFTLTLRELK